MFGRVCHSLVPAGLQAFFLNFGDVNIIYSHHNIRTILCTNWHEPQGTFPVVFADF